MNAASAVARRTECPDQDSNLIYDHRGGCAVPRTGQDPYALALLLAEVGRDCLNRTLLSSQVTASKGPTEGSYPEPGPA